VLRISALVIVSIAVVLFFLQLVGYSRLRTNYPPGMTIAGVPVGGTDPQVASERLIQVYNNTPVELQYAGSVIHMDPGMAGFDLDLDAMLAAADLERTGGSFWLGFWDNLWNRESQVPDVPLVATIAEDQLRTYLASEISARYDQPASAHPVAGGLTFKLAGQEPDVEQAALIGDALSIQPQTLTRQHTPRGRPWRLQTRQQIIQFSV
jgi:hypothetical protein